MRPSRESGFTLIELLVVIAVIAVLAGILLPVFAQAREKARMTACSSNIGQIARALVLYTQDYDEAFPCIYFRGFSGRFTKDFHGNRIVTWRNALRPYLNSIDVFACPSNPFHNPIAGSLCVTPPVPGSNADGWEVEPGQRMPVSYGMNACAASWIPMDQKGAAPPLRQSQLARPAETILVNESRWGVAEFSPEFLWDNTGRCSAVFTHPGSKLANFIFCDGHAKAKRWVATLYPLTENNWQAGLPNPDPQNHRLVGAADCDFQVPPGPDAKEFQASDCRAWQ
jgi:prepilin-type N-terminal cleavage/methylation domain-containing protein/prepilin-type processing-associated H-X9-DG protein